MKRKRYRDRGLAKAISAAGSISALASRIKVTVQAVSQWESVPVNRCIDVERETGVPRDELRPDVFGQPDMSIPAASSQAA
jgi:DNA-binding transcriptional regulator YdaS (Cro superfamily)